MCLTSMSTVTFRAEAAWGADTGLERTSQSSHEQASLPPCFTWLAAAAFCLVAVVAAAAAAASLSFAAFCSAASRCSSSCVTKVHFKGVF